MARLLRNLGLVLFACLLTFVAGLGVGLALFKVSPPESLAGAQLPTSLPVTKRQFDDARTLTLEVSPGTSSTLTSPLAGRVTSTAELGGQLASGQLIAEVNGQPIVALATSVPLWRDLPSDARGDDVASLQVELLRLGKEVEVTGVVDRATRRAAAETLGVYDADSRLWSTIPAANWLWIQSPQIAIEGVEVVVGQSVGPGTPLLSVPGEAPSVRLASVPPDALPGDRVIIVGDTVFPVNEVGQLTEPVMVQRLLDSAQFEAAKKQADGNKAVTLRVPWTLTKAVDVYAVPPQALFGTVGSDACVQSDGSAVHVQIVTSELGRALVTSHTPLSTVAAEPTVPCPSN